MRSSWEENTERRLGILEQKMDKLLDPEHGIYPKLSHIDRRIAYSTVGILLGLVANLVLLAVKVG